MSQELSTKDPMAAFSQATIVGEPQPKTWDNFERNCLATFGGGHRGECFEAFQHGMSTVFNLLRAEFPPAEQCKAAPELMDACREFVAHYPRGINPYLDEARSKAFDAIAKAQGKP